MNRTRIAVLGLYRSGSTALAGILDHLGVDMGAPFFGGYYESKWLSEQLRLWWDEPNLTEKVAQPERVRILSQWIQEREHKGAQRVGMKHPLLSLCGEDLLKAWGEDTRFVRCCRPLDESVESMKRGLGYRGDAHLLQGTLLAALDAFLAGRDHLQIQFADLMKNPAGEIQRLIEYLYLTPEQEKIATAIRFVEPGAQAKVEAERRAARRGIKRLKPTRLLEALKRTVKG